MQIKLLTLLMLASISNLCLAQHKDIKSNSAIFENYIAEFSVHKNKPLPDIFALTGKFFLNKPYVASTLEGNEVEQLVVNFKEFDCTTFVETCLALSIELKKEKSSFTGFKNTLQSLRYYGGIIDGYTSRMHYTTDWVHHNKGRVKDITKEIGGYAVDKPIHFMSTKSPLYAQLKTNAGNIKKIKEVEKAINQRKSYTLLPIAKIKQAENKIQTGDIIIFGTKTQGLDYSHLGIALWQNGVLKLLHASSAQKKVIVDKKSLVEYCNTSKTCSGITVLRPTN